MLFSIIQQTRTAGATVARSPPERKVIRSNRVRFNSKQECPNFLHFFYVSVTIPLGIVLVTLWNLAVSFVIGKLLSSWYGCQTHNMHAVSTDSCNLYNDFDRL